MDITTLESLVKILFLTTAAIAVFTQIASTERVADWMSVDSSKMKSRHRYFGWVSMVGLMSLLVWGGYSPVKASGILNRLIFLHIPLLLVCTAAILFVAFKEERKRIREDGFQKITWIFIFILGACFTIDMLALLIRRYGWFSTSLPFLQIIPYPAFVFAHAFIAFGIVVIRNLQVRGSSGSTKAQFWAGDEPTQADP